jgi:glutaredoxin
LSLGSKWWVACALLAVSGALTTFYRMTTQSPSISPAGRVPPSEWSNPGKEVLKKVAPDLWVAERPFIWNSIDVGGKMAVVRLADGSLWVHSPVELDAPLKAALAALGPVKYIMSPNYEHVKYAQQWIDAYPDAIAYGCPGAKEKFPQISFQAEVGVGNAVPEAWASDLLVTYMDCEHNPFTRSPFFNEVVFVHLPTKTLIVTDLFWNYPIDAPAGTRAWKWGMDEVYLPFYKQFMICDRSRFKTAVDRIVAWDFDSVLPCHGTYIAQGGKEAFVKHLGVPSVAAGAVGGQGAAPKSVGQMVAQTIEAAEMQRVQSSSVEGADGYRGEPEEWADAASPTQKLSEISQIGPFAEGKKWLAKQLAGDYDAQEMQRKMQEFEGSSSVTMYSFTTCPFCKRAKDILNEIGAEYEVMELDVVPEGKAIRAELGDRTGRTSMPSVWIQGQYIGGCNDGGLGGVAKLQEQGKLLPLLQEAGAVRSA